jgi:hypothetical protein
MVRFLAIAVNAVAVAFRSDLAIFLKLGITLWLGWPCLTKKIQSKKPRPSTPPSKSFLAAGKTRS